LFQLVTASVSQLDLGSSQAVQIGVVWVEPTFNLPLDWQETYAESLSTFGGTVTLTGMRLSSTTQVGVNSVNCSSISVVNDTAVRCTLAPDNNFLRPGWNMVYFYNNFDAFNVFRLYFYARLVDTPAAQYIAQDCPGVCTRTISVTAAALPDAMDVAPTANIRGNQTIVEYTQTRMAIQLSGDLIVGPLNATVRSPFAFRSAVLTVLFYF
jgi:hypothetical protein